MREFFDRDSIEAINMIGSICSLIALLLVLSDNFSVPNVIQIALSVLFAVCFGGLILKFFLYLYMSIL